MGLFGPSRKEIWRQLSEAAGARYVEGGFLKSDKVEVDHEGWTITLDTEFNPATKTTETRLCAPFTSRDDFRFTIYRRSIFTGLGKMLSMQDVEIGHEEFDSDFVIQGTDESRLRSLFASDALRQLLKAQPRVMFTVKHRKKPQDGEFIDAELVFSSGGVIKDVERLQGLFDLFAETLDQLCRLGSAREPR